MKKLIIAAVCLAAAAISAYATVGFKSWCGKVVYTLDFGEVPEFMTDEEIKDFYQAINIELCGSEGDYEIIHY